MSDTMITSKITSKAQTTIPRAVREALRVRAGDELAYKIERGRVIMTRAVRTPADEESRCAPCAHLGRRWLGNGEAKIVDLCLFSQP